MKGEGMVFASIDEVQHALDAVSASARQDHCA